MNEAITIKGVIIFIFILRAIIAFIQDFINWWDKNS